MTVLAISGSLQRVSSNTALLRAAQRSAPGGVDIVFSPALAEIPHFNPDLDGEDVAAAVTAWRRAVAAADGLLFATPEYAYGMPGALKNALDWLVGTGELSGKPAAVMSASPTMTGGIRAQAWLVQTLTAQGASVVDTLAVPMVRAKLDAQGEIVHPRTLARIAMTVDALREVIAG